MKRWIIFIGRGGTLLITIGFALLLVSFIPSARLSTYAGKTAIPPKWAQPTIDQILSPQQGLQVTITSNGTLDIYLVEVSSLVLYQWGNHDLLNETDLTEFLNANPSSIGWHDKVQNGSIVHEYIPTKVTNATLVLFNPSSEYVPVDYEISLTSLVGPGAKVRNLAQWTIPIGFVFALPWLTQFWKEKTTGQNP